MFFKILQTGSLVRDDCGNVLDAHSTVTYIQSRRHRILVDTGRSEDFSGIRRALENLRVQPDQIDLIINTHAHGDHTGCNRRFKNADVMIHACEHGTAPPAAMLPRGRRFRLPLLGRSVDPNVTVIESTGHTAGSISVMVRGIGSDFSSPEETVVIAGDAIPLRNNFLKWVPPAINVDERASIASMAAVVDLADWIVPGHDDAFWVGAVFRQHGHRVTIPEGTAPRVAILPEAEKGSGL